MNLDGAQKALLGLLSVFLALLSRVAVCDAVCLFCCRNGMAKKPDIKVQVHRSLGQRLFSVQPVRSQENFVAGRASCTRIAPEVSQHFRLRSIHPRYHWSSLSWVCLR